MHRRALLFAALSVPVLSAGCGLLPAGPLVIVCDPDLVEPMERAGQAWPGLRDAQLVVQSDISARQLGQMMEALRGGLIATREPKQANRIQRLGLARLEHRWTREIDGGPVALVATRGEGLAEAQAIRFGKWLASPEADRFVDPPAARPAA